MKLYAPLAAAVLLLSGCGEAEAPAPLATRTPVAEAAAPEIPVMGPERRILAIGDSLLTGHGLDGDQGYPERLEAALRARGINARIVNAGVSGDTTADGRGRLGFALDAQEQPPELVVISLGGNDMLRGLPPATVRENLDAMLAELGRREIDALLLGMLAPPNFGAEYRREFDGLYAALARKHDAALVPFFLQPLIDKPDLFQSDHIHPTAGGIEAMVAATVDDVAKALPER